jgi:hypothetical protein
MPHLDAVTATCRALVERHVPFGIVTRRNLADLSRWKVVAVPGVLTMDDEEAAALRAYVKAGGRLYVSGPGLLRGALSSRRADFVLSDVLGVSFRGETEEGFTYMAPTAKGAGLFGDASAAFPMGLYSKQFVAEPAREGEVLATITLPYTDPADPLHFSSTHNNPPGTPTGHPAVVFHRYGAGQALWVAGALETTDNSQDALCPLLLKLAGTPTVQTTAPRVVEVTVFSQRDRKRLVVSLVNFPKDMPPLVVRDISVTVQTGRARAARVVRAPGGEPVPFTTADGSVTFVVPEMETFAMLAVEVA